MKPHLIIRVTEYGLKHSKFTLDQLNKDLQLNEDEYTYVRNTITKMNGFETDNPNHVLVFNRRDPNRTTTNYDFDEYTILPSAYYNYQDHLEIVAARKAAQEAKRLSIAAIIISSILAIAQIIFAIKFES